MKPCLDLLDNAPDQIPQSSDEFDRPSLCISVHLLGREGRSRESTLGHREPNGAIGGYEGRGDRRLYFRCEDPRPVPGIDFYDQDTKAEGGVPSRTGPSVQNRQANLPSDRGGRGPFFRTQS